MQHAAMADIPWLKRSAASAFVGTLEIWPLWDLLMWLHVSHQTAHVALYANGVEGSLDFVRGQLQRCTYQGVEGIIALERMLGLEMGDFTVDECAIAEGPRNIAVGTEQLLFGVLRSEPPSE